MKRRIFVLLLVLALCLAGCEKAPGEETLPSETETVPTTAVPTTVPPETTVPPTTVPPETTEPEVLLFPKGEVQAVLLYYADILYVQEEETVSELPEEYVYAGTVFEGKPDAVPSQTGVGCHLPAGTEFFGSPVNPDYLFTACEEGFKRMVRAGLADTGWSKTAVKTAAPENYTQVFFRDLFTLNTVGENYYNIAAPMEFNSPRYLNLQELFYNGFAELNQGKVPLTEEETAFLLANGFGENMPLSDAERIPEANMDAVLQRFFGLSLAETKGVGLKEIGVYHKESKCYYAWFSGMNWCFIDVAEARYDEETGTGAVTITCDVGVKYQMEMTLQREENVLRMVSNKRTDG